MSAWKSDELKVCRLAGAERTGPVGRDGPDCTDAAPWAIQVKRRPRIQLPASWLEQATRDCDTDNVERCRRGLWPREWLVVQVWPRRGRASLHIATMDFWALNTLAGAVAERIGETPEWGVVLRRSPARPYLRAEEVTRLYAETPRQPWLITQRTPRWQLATLDYRELVRLGRLAALLPSEPREE